jgi:2-succinyl-6-hydroxy-2,4-cyclohexadiene-1-carboxylate synthase
VSVRKIAARGIEFEVEEHGSGERAFVLVHGYTGSRDDWREQLPVLAELGHTVAIDQRGHGGSGNSGDPADYTFDGLVDDLLAVLDALGLERCDLLGHSMGGVVALRFALAHPDRLHSLVAMDTAASPMRMPKRMREAGAELVQRGGMGALYKVMRERAATDPNRPAASRAFEERIGSEAYGARVERKLLQMDPVAFVELGRQLAEAPPIVERLAEIRCPSLVLVGEQDALVEAADELEAGLPDVQRVTVPDAAHSPQHENPAAWFEAIRAHLARARNAQGASRRD